MKLEEVIKKKIAILGFGIEGEALVEYLSSKGAKDLTVFDVKDQPTDKRSRLEKLEIGLVVGKFEDADLNKYNYIFRSPGINLERIKGIVSDPATISSATNLFFAQCKARIVGITGTKGKSTTAKIIEKILRLNNKNVFLGGNIGTVPLKYLDQLSSDSTVVVELSSFQLDDLAYSPQIAIILPVTSDHLNYHRNTSDYVSAKSNICRYQGETDAVIFYDGGQSREIAAFSKGKKLAYLDHLSEDGCSIRGEDVVCGGELVATGAVLYSSKLKIPLVDIIAAVAFANMMNFEISLDEVFKDFEKMPYRIEFIGEKNGVKFYNDSASTNPVSTIAAVKIFDQPYLLIAGGSSKGLDYAEMANILSRDQNLKGVYLYGSTATEIEDALKSSGYGGEIHRSSDLAGSVEGLKDRLHEVKSVLFSPASASFDQFDNYAKRGEYFSDLIKKQ